MSTRLHERRRGSDTQSTGSEGRSRSACPECSGRIVDDAEHGEAVCDECGLVLSGDALDRGPEWRNFDDEETADRSRVEVSVAISSPVTVDNDFRITPTETHSMRKVSPRRHRTPFSPRGRIGEIL
nr:TFIIB-type zinc ribbon-containing protein [Halococcus salsus]